MRLQKRLAADVLGCSEYRVRFDQSKLAEIGEAITKEDIRSLVAGGVITCAPVAGVSRARAKERHVQRTRGRRRGLGSRKGPMSSREQPKDVWIAAIRKQRALLKRLKSKGLITNETFTKAYLLAKGSFFRSERHLKMYLEEQGLFIKG